MAEIEDENELEDEDELGTIASKDTRANENQRRHPLRQNRFHSIRNEINVRW